MYKSIKIRYELWKEMKQVALDEEKSMSEIIRIAFYHTFGKGTNK